MGIVQESTERISDQDGTERIPDQDGTARIPDQDGTERVPDQDGAERIPDPDGTERIPGQDGTERIPYQDGCCQIFDSDDDAWKMAKGLGTLALTIFCAVTVVGIVEEVDTLWISSLVVVVLLLLLSAALATSVRACRRTPRRDLQQTLDNSTV